MITLNQLRALILFSIVLSLLPAQAQMRSLFNGKDLSGWKQINGYARFEVSNGEIVGTTVVDSPNSFLATEELFDDFILELEFKMDGTNTGVQVRSESKPDYQQGRVHGYQVDFDPTPRAWTGGIYDEGRRGWLYPLDYNTQARTALKLNDWNTCRIECIGNSIRTWINGVATAYIVDNMTRKGFIALQVHQVGLPDVGKQVRWRNVRIQTENLKPSKADKIFVADFIQIKKLNDESRGWKIQERWNDKSVDVYYNGKLITALIWPDSIFKPVLYPVKTLSGITVTREFPLQLKTGERADHPHQVGLFFAHESVNGIDFWNLSTAIAPSQRKGFGKIQVTRVLHAQGWEQDAYLAVVAQWKTYEGKALIEETMRFHFKAEKNTMIIDRKSEWKALDESVVFKDVKDAGLGIRVSRELELTNSWEDPFVLPDKTISEKKLNNEGATGTYKNSEAIAGESVWGKQAKWLLLQGKREGNNISIVMIDHPSNMGYPANWHARGYGLMAINSFGSQAFGTENKPVNVSLKKNETLSLYYRVVIQENAKSLDNLIANWVREFQTK